MLIKMIGSGSMWSKFNSASYLIDGNIMVDFPNGACKYLYRFGIEPKEVDHVLITHFHGDHYFDLPFYVLNKSKASDIKTNIYCSKDGKRKILKISKFAFPNSYKDFFRDSGVSFNFMTKFKVNNYNVTKVLVDHGRMKPAYGYIFESNKRFIGFTGDTSLCEGVRFLASKCDYLFCDVSLIQGTSKHMGTNDIVNLCNEFNECTFIASHMLDETREELKKYNLKNLIIGEDGKEFRI